MSGHHPWPPPMTHPCCIVYINPGNGPTMQYCETHQVYCEIRCPVATDRALDKVWQRGELYYEDSMVMMEQRDAAYLESDRLKEETATLRRQVTDLETGVRDAERIVTLVLGHQTSPAESLRRIIKEQIVPLLTRLRALLGDK